MCLIFTHHKDTVLDEGWIKNFHYRNPDGIGVMSSGYDANNVPIVSIEKFLPRNGTEAWEFYKGHIQGKECVVHFRMMTHGKVNHENVHPYIIAGTDEQPTLAFMHNGILSCGNSADKDKSDTWHFNEYYLKPLLDPIQNGHPDLAMKEEFALIMGEFIGTNNRFVFMDDLGRTQIVNEDTGVYWRGMWLANTYAWDAPNHVFGVRHGRYKKGVVEEEHDDFKDVAPDPWEYEDGGWWTGYHGGATTAGKWSGTGSKTTGTSSLASNPHLVPVPSSGTNVVVANNGTGKETVALTHDTPFGRRNISEWKLNQFDSIFDMLKANGRAKAWAKITYKDLDNFEDHSDLDQLWDAVYMCVDGDIEQDRFIDLIRDPRKWDMTPERHKRYVTPTRVDSEDEVPGDSFAPSEEEVIAATLPRRNDAVNDDLGVEAAFPRIMPPLDANGRPVYDSRTEV